MNENDSMLTLKELQTLGATVITARNTFEGHAHNSNRCGSLPVLDATPCLMELDEWGECPNCDTI